MPQGSPSKISSLGITSGPFYQILFNDTHKETTFKSGKEKWIVGGLMSCLYKQGGRFSVTGCHSGIQ